MTKLLPILLESLEHAGPERRKELARKVDPKLYFELADGSRKPVRELIQSADANSTTLVQAEVYRTVIEGATPAVAMRNALDSIQMNSNQLRVNYGAAGVYAPEIAEGAEYPVYIQDYTPVTFTAKKYGQSPAITRELVIDWLFDVLNVEIKVAAAAVENRLNYQALDAILEGSGTEHDTTGSNQGVKAVAAAIGVNKTANYLPTDLVLHPEAEAILLQDYIPTGAYYQVGNATTTGAVPAPVLGLNAHGVGVSTSGTTYTWGYGADSEIGMLVLDRNRGAKIGMREDTRVEQFEEPLRDLTRINVSIRFDVQVIQANAITRIEY